MGDKTLTAAEAEKEFWDHLKKSNTGMLGLDQPGYHAQPMTAFREEETGTIWFFTRDDTDLAKDAAVGGGQSAMFHYGSKDQNVWACIHGNLSVHGQDRAIIDRYWNPILAAWYPDGKDDPRLTLLRMRLDDAQVWLSQAGPVRFAFEIAKANMTRDQPDLGGRADIRF